MHVNNVYFVYTFLVRDLRQTVLDYLAAWPVRYLPDHCFLPTTTAEPSDEKVAKTFVCECTETPFALVRSRAGVAVPLPERAWTRSNNR